MKLYSSSGDNAFETAMRGLLGHGPVAEAAAYHLDAGGSRVRAQLACAAAAALGLDQASASACAAACELLHNASLVHDDLQERDVTRRGRPAVWARFDPAVAICVGDLMISAAYGSLAAHPDPSRAIAIMHDAVAETARGQSRDMQAHVTTLEGYRALAAAKTGPLLALPVRLALCAAGLPGDARATEIGARMAVAYQALDDLDDREADRAAGRVNLCALLEEFRHAPADASRAARAEARAALEDVRRLSTGLPADAGVAYRNLADRLDSALTEISDAA